MAEERTEQDVINEYLKSQSFIDTINAEKSKSVEKYKLERLPALEADMRDRIVKELNPEETEQDKKIRELTEWKKAAEIEKLTNQRKSLLREKAKDIGFDVSKADRYAVYGEEAEKAMISDHEFITTHIKSALEEKIKGSYESQKPVGSEKTAGKMTINDLKGKSVVEIRQLKAAGLVEGL